MRVSDIVGIHAAASTVMSREELESRVALHPIFSKLSSLSAFSILRINSITSQANIKQQPNENMPSFWARLSFFYSIWERKKKGGTVKCIYFLC